MRGHEMPESAGSGGSAPSSASSSALTAGCSAGLFLPYQAHQAISSSAGRVVQVSARRQSNAVMSQAMSGGVRSEEHTSELQSQSNLVCRLLLEKKNKIESCSFFMYAISIAIYVYVCDRLPTQLHLAVALQIILSGLRRSRIRTSGNRRVTLSTR